MEIINVYFTCHMKRCAQLYTYFQTKHFESPPPPQTKDSRLTLNGYIPIARFSLEYPEVLKLESVT